MLVFGFSHISRSINPLPLTLSQTANFRLFQKKKKNEFADHNFEFDENSRKVSKRVENTVGKGEIA